uniref:insulin-degrading enzyme-like n=1 Tax=Fragaria vesca subsp. vesca TaxID=101020 RepID=UPI0005CAB675
HEGNKKSLDDAKDNGINLQERILKLYRDYYHGGLMKLVVIGGESLNVLEHWVLELFGDVKKGPQVKLEFKTEGPIWKAGKLYRLEAVDDVHILHLAWILPCLQEHYLKKPEGYLCHLLGHEGRGSLYSYLKARGWVTSLDAGVSKSDCSSVAYIFCMVIYLTDSGLEKIFEIIGFVYQYIELLRQMSPQEWIFRELHDIGNMEFIFAEEQDHDDYASGLAENLLCYATEHVIYGDYVNESWDKELIEYVLGFFWPENMRIDVISKSLFKSEDFQCEPWFGSHYTEEDISPYLRDLWKNPQETNVSLHLPEKNDFIPRDFSIRSDGLCIDTAMTYPRCILDQPLMKFWYKLDSTFKLPHVNTYFRINLKGAYDNVKSCVLTSLYLDLLTDELNEILYEASVASLQTSFSLSQDKLQLLVYGFHDKLPALLSKILETVKSFLPTDDRFEVFKEDMGRAYANTNMDAWSYSTYLRDQVLLQSFYTVDEQLHVLNGLSVSDLISFIPEIFSQLYIEGLLHGNLSEEEAITLAKSFQQNFAVPPLPTELVYRNHCICLPPNANLIIDTTVKNKSETNSVLQLYFQIEQAMRSESIRLKLLVDLFHEIVQEPFFDQLRTKEQLGYVVLCGWTHTCKVFGFYFSVQSSKYNPVHLQSRLENFIVGLEELLKGLDDDSFENYKGGLMAKLFEKDASLTCETYRLWTQILGKWYTFEYSKMAAEQLISIQKEDVTNFYKTYLHQSSPKCRRLTTRVWGCNTDLKEAEEARPESEQVIEDLSAFKMSSKFYDGKRCQKVTPLNC